MALLFQFDPEAPRVLVEAVLDTFDFTLVGADQSLGRDLLNAGAVGISLRSQRGKNVDGSDFAPNDPDYAKYKSDRYHVDQPGELGGQMFGLEAIKGESRIEPELITMVYGQGITPTTNLSRKGVELKPSELTLTDREKAALFEARGNEFWGFDDEIEAEVVKVAQEALDAHARTAGI